MPNLTPQLQSAYLQPLISRADHLGRFSSGGLGRKIVAIHPTTRKTRNKLPLFRARQWRRFLVTLSGSVKRCDPFHITLSDSRGTTRKDIVCEVSIKRLEPGWEAILVNGLCMEATPEAALEKLIEGYLQDFIDDAERTHPDCLRRFSRHRDHAQIHVRDSAGIKTDETGVARGLGLHLVCVIKLPEDDLKPMDFPDVVERLMCRDFDQPVPSKLEVHLEVPRDDPAMKAKAQESGQLLEDFKENFHLETIRWFRQECTLHDYCTQRTDVRDRLRAHLNTQAKEHGREVTFLKIEPTVEPDYPREESIAHLSTVDIDITKDGGAQKTFIVRVNHTVQITTKNVAEWQKTKLAHGISDHRAWIKSLLQKRSEEALKGRSYGTIVVHFEWTQAQRKKHKEQREEHARRLDPLARGHSSLRDQPNDAEEADLDNVLESDLKSMIQKSVRDSLEEAGLSVRQFTTTPDLPVRKLLVEGFRFDTQDNAAQPPADQARPDVEFKTSDSRVPFKMAISVSGKLKSLDQFEEFLADPEADIVGRIRRSVVRAAEDEVVKYKPKSLVLDFDSRDSSGMSPCLAITQAIERALADSDDLDAITESVVLRPLKGRLNERWEELTPAQNHKFEMAVAGRGGLDDKMNFTVEFRVTGIDDTNWASFQAHCDQHEAHEQIKAMEGKLETFGTIQIKSYHADTLRKQKATDFHNSRDEIFAEAVGLIATELGLQVQVTSMLRNDSAREKPIADMAGTIFQRNIETALELQQSLKAAELDPTGIGADREKIDAQKEAFKNKVGGSLGDQITLPGSRGNTLALGAGQPDEAEEETFFGKNKAGKETP